MNGSIIKLNDNNVNLCKRALESLINNKNYLVEQTKSYPVICEFDTYRFVFRSDKDIDDLIKVLKGKIKQFNSTLKNNLLSFATKGFMEMNEVVECAQTFDAVKKELEGIELKLAQRLHIPVKQCRQTLIALSQAGALEEDSLVADWYEVYQSYLAWTRDNS